MLRAINPWLIQLLNCPRTWVRQLTTRSAYARNTLPSASLSIGRNQFRVDRRTGVAPLSADRGWMSSSGESDEPHRSH